MTAHRVSKVLILLVLFLCSLISLGADQKKTSDSTGAPTFTSKSELVLVPTVVTDRSGEHVSGLTKDDFQVLDERRPQEIKIFEEVTTSSGQPQRTSLAAKGEFSNRVIAETGTAEKPRRLTIIAFDLINMPTLKQASARKALLDFLAETAGANEPTALYSITRKGVTVIADFTTDPKILAETLKKMKYGTKMEVGGLEGKPHDNPTSAGGGVGDGAMNISVAQSSSPAAKQEAIMRAMEEFATTLELNMSSFERRFAVDHTLENMHQIAQACAAIPGRKSLIWVGGGFPFDINPTDMMLQNGDATQNYPTPAGRSGLDQVLPLYMRLWRDLNDAQVAVYPVDVRGLFNPYVGGARVGTACAQCQPAIGFENQQTNSTYQSFAQATGGKTFYGSNDLKAGFALAAKDSSHYYLIGYYIKPENATKIQWRAITVKSPRKGIDIRARSGYFYQPTGADVQLSRQHDLSAGLLSPVDFTAISVTVRWTKNEPGSDGARHLGFELVMPAGFAEVDASDNNHLVSDIVAQAKKLDGTPVGTMLNRTMDAHLNAEQLQQLKAQGLTYANALDLLPGDYVVRFVVRDGINGHMGSVAASLRVQ